METETYKKAKEILEKFDPETKKKLEEEKRQLETPNRVPSVSSPDTGKLQIQDFSTHDTFLIPRMW